MQISKNSLKFPRNFITLLPEFCSLFIQTLFNGHVKDVCQHIFSFTNG